MLLFVPKPTHLKISRISSKPLSRKKKGHVKRIDAQIEELKAEWLENRLIEAGLKHARSRGWNDTYTYMKFLAEQMVMELRGELADYYCATLNY